jgi:hypothetical protein
MSATNTFESDVLKLIFQNTDAALIGDATGLRGSSAAGDLYISLHTADPGEAGSQNTNETSYTGYARISVARSGAGWTVSGSAPTQVTNASAVTFGLCTVGTPTITHFGVGTDLAGAGKLLFSGALTASLAVSPGIIPQFNAGALVVTAD